MTPSQPEDTEFLVPPGIQFRRDRITLGFHLLACFSAIKSADGMKDASEAVAGAYADLELSPVEAAAVVWLIARAERPAQLLKELTWGEFLQLVAVSDQRSAKFADATDDDQPDA